MQIANYLQRTIFQQIDELYEGECVIEEIQNEPKNKRIFQQFRQQLKRILYNKQNICLRENLVNLHNSKFLEGFAEDLSPTVQQCFHFFSQALANARSLRILDISGMEIHPLLAIEIGIGLQHNTSLRELHMGSCKMNSFSLQYIFSSLTNHKKLQLLNVFNNQGFTDDLVNDLNYFLFQGKNNLRKLKLTHCNISTTGLSYLFRNIKSSKSIRQLDVSMMYFNTEVLTSLGIALEEYKGKEVLESLNISYCNIRDSGLQTLAQRVSWNIRKINVQELNLRSNQITQGGVQYLEAFLKEINQLKKLDLSYNKIEEFSSSELHSRKMYEVHLVKNCISTFPNYFFMNTLVINLQNNNISSRGAFQLSSILRQNPLWIELNLTSNSIQSEGFNSIIFGLRDNTMLKKLMVADNQLDGESIICYMINHEQVQFEYLDISHNQIRIELIYELLNNIKNGMLRSLKCSYLSGGIASDEYDINMLGSSGSQTFQIGSFNLRELDFNGNKNILSTISLSLSTYYNKIEKLNLANCSPITDSEIEQLCLFLRKSAMIRELILSNLNLGSLKSETMKNFSDAISLSNLRSLNISRAKLYKNIKKIFKLNTSSINFKLESLDLSCNCLEGKHLIYIEKILKRFRNLQEINLSHNWLNFECLNAINRALSENESIKIINLSSQKLSADDLLILSQTLQSESLRELNLSNNMYTTRTKTYFKQCSTLRQEQITFQHIYFDESYFQSLMTIIQKQKRNIKRISFYACFFRPGDYLKFTHELQKCKKLEAFEIIYNPNLDMELENQLQYVETFSVKFLKLAQVNIPYAIIEKLSQYVSKQNCHLISIDFSQVMFQQDSLDTLCYGISQNTTVRELVLNSCQLGQFDLTMLGIMIRKNNSISILELANNAISTLDKLIIGLRSESSFSSLGKLNLSGNQLQDDSLAQLFIPQQARIKCLTVSTLDLTSCHINNQILQSILQAQIEYRNNYSLANLISLCLANNNLDHQSGMILKDIIINCPYLQEISLPKNELGSQGSLEIFKGVMQSQSVKTLDLSHNLISDLMVETISIEFLRNQLNSLQFLLLRGNTFTQKAQRKLVEIIVFQKRLFIDYVWSKIYDNDGEQILLQYTKLGQSYHLQQHSMPYFVKEIIISNAHLTDKFTEMLSKYYPLLSFIEFIDISDNPYITMYGKVYLFIHIFDQSYAKHHLKALYIGDSKETTKIYDDGLLRFLLLKFRNFLYPPNMHIPNKQANSQAELFRANLEKKSQVQSIIGRLWGSWLLHKINQLMKYLDKIEPPQFIVSTLFLGKFRRNNIEIKTIVVILGIASLLICLSQFYYFIFHSPLNYDDVQKEFDEICKDPNSCSQFNQHLIRQDYTYLAIQFISILLVECCQLGVGVFLRRKIEPAFQIIHPNLLKYYKDPFPHTYEILRMIFSIIWKLSSLPERLLLYYLATFKYTDVKGYQYQLRSSNIIIFTLVIIRVSKFLLLILYNNYTFLRMKPNEDVAKYLQLLQKAIHYEGYFVISETLVNLCPQQGFQLTKSIVINEEIFVSTITILFIEISTSASFGILYNEYTNLIHNNFKGHDPLGMFSVWILFAFIKSLLTILIMLFRIFTVRPAVVRQHAFNQGLTLKRFAENRNKFVPSSHMKIEPSLECQIIPDEALKKKTKIVKTDQEYNYLNSSLKMNEMEDIVEEDDIIEEDGAGSSSNENQGEDGGAGSSSNENQGEDQTDNDNVNLYRESDTNRRNDSLIDDELSPLK